MQNFLITPLQRFASFLKVVRNTQRFSSLKLLGTAKMTLFSRFSNLSPKTKNFVVAGGLSSFVLGVYYYTMRAVGGTDELQVAIEKFEEMNSKTEPGTATSPGP